MSPKNVVCGWTNGCLDSSLQRVTHDRCPSSSLKDAYHMKRVIMKPINSLFKVFLKYSWIHNCVKVLKSKLLLVKIHLHTNETYLPKISSSPSTKRYTSPHHHLPRCKSLLATFTKVYKSFRHLYKEGQILLVTLKPSSWRNFASVPCV